VSNPTFPSAIDNSMRKELVKCEMAAHYKYELNLRANDTSTVDLIAGKAFAAGMEAMRKAYYIGEASPYDALQLGIKALYASYGSFIPPAKSNKTADRMAGALAYYCQEFPLESEPLQPVTLPDGRRLIEVGYQFSTGITHPDTGLDIPYVCNFDMLAWDDQGDAWVVDEKTTSQMGDKWANQWLLDSQMTGYCMGARLILEEARLDYPVRGAIINGIAIRLRDYEVKRWPTYREQWEIDRWFEQMQNDLTHWKAAYRHQDHRQILDHACANYNNPCEFAILCKSRNPERLIEGSYHVVKWNPVTRTEE
jgi:PD-(D/E)XK nuclease superfamily protein